MAMAPEDSRAPVTPCAPVTRRAFLGACAAFAAGSAAGALSGCVDQHPDDAAASDGDASSGAGLRLIATTPAIAEICDRLDLDLVGVCESDNVPERYAEVERVGAPMSPDLEIVSSLSPDYVLSPNTLQSDLQPQYAAAGVAALFLDLKSVEGMYASIDDLGDLLDCREEADALIAEYEEFIEEYRASVEGSAAPSVLVLMGLPGSYIVATENSYVGSLVELAGGENIYAGTDEEFLSVNTEDMQSRDADVILRAAHALPDEVAAMFAEEFETNDIWRHFRAVQEGRVYDLPYDLFGMSATFSYPDALDHLRPLLYEEDA